MIDADILADTVLRDQAIVVVGEVISKFGFPVEQRQIAGLRQIANNEPNSLKEFADHQQQRAKNRLALTNKPDKQEQFQNEMYFWEVIAELCTVTKKREWTLEALANGSVPASMQQEALPAGAKLSREQQDERKKRNRLLAEHLTNWRRTHYRSFFQHFCAEYMYRRATLPTGGDHESD